MVPVYFKMFQLIFNEKLSTSEVGSLVLQKMPRRLTGCQEHVSRSQILLQEIYIKKIQNYIDTFFFVRLSGDFFVANGFSLDGRL